MNSDWFVTKYGVFANDDDNQFKNVAHNELSHKWGHLHRQLTYGLDPDSKIVSTSDDLLFALTSLGNLYHCFPFAYKICKTPEPVIAIHGPNIIECKSGKFYQYVNHDWEESEYEPIITYRLLNYDFKYEYRNSIEICYIGVQCQVFEGITRFKSVSQALDEDKQLGEPIIEEWEEPFAIMDYCNNLLLTTAGRVYCIKSRRIIERIQIKPVVYKINKTAVISGI